MGCMELGRGERLQTLTSASVPAWRTATRSWAVVVLVVGVGPCWPCKYQLVGSSVEVDKLIDSLFSELGGRACESEWPASAALRRSDARNLTRSRPRPLSGNATMGRSSTICSGCVRRLSTPASILLLCEQW